MTDYEIYGDLVSEPVQPDTGLITPSQPAFDDGWASAPAVDTAPTMVSAIGAPQTSDWLTDVFSGLKDFGTWLMTPFTSSGTTTAAAEKPAENGKPAEAGKSASLTDKLLVAIAPKAVEALAAGLGGMSSENRKDREVEVAEGRLAVEQQAQQIKNNTAQRNEAALAALAQQKGLLDPVGLKKFYATQDASRRRQYQPKGLLNGLA